MDQKEILTIGIIAAFAFAAIVSIKPAEAQNNEGVAQAGAIVDNDINTQLNIETVIQTSVNIPLSGSGDSTASTDQSVQTSQSNNNEDNDAQTVGSTQED